MRRWAVLMAALLVAVSCGGSGATTSSTIVTTTVSVIDDTTTTTAAVADDATTEFAAASRALLEVIAERGVAAPSIGAGTLSESGVFVDVLGAEDVPEVDLDIRVIQDQDGLLWFAVFGDIDQLSASWIEFDAVAEDGVTVVADTSVVGTGVGPPWVETATNGSVIVLEVPENGVQSLRGGAVQERYGYLVRGQDIEVREGGFAAPDQADDQPLGVRLSVWIYRRVADVPSTSESTGAWAFGHRVVEYQQVSEPETFEELLAIYIAALVRLREQQTEALDSIIAAFKPPERIVPIIDPDQ